MLLRPARPASSRAAARIRPAARGDNARRATRIIALKHVPAQDTMQTIRQWVAAEQLQSQTPPVTIVPDAITNHLLVTAESSQLESIEEIVENLDRPAPRIQIRAMIAELHLKEAPEPGVGATSKIPAKENLEEMLAMLKKRGEVHVIARPELTTASNQPAFVQFGSRVPRITGTTVSQGRGMTNSVTMENVGTILAVTGRVEDKGRVTLEIDVESSHLGPDDEGTPVAVTDGKTIHTREVKVLVLQTTVALQSGQCMLVGGQVAHTPHGWRETVLLLQATVTP
jgi:type II secretory pathway component GspD/PulD (secretin)